MWYNNIYLNANARKGRIKMDEIFEKIKFGAKKVKKGAKQVTKQVVRKTNDAVSHTKIRFAINETEGKVTELYEEIGRAVYGEYLKTGETSEDMLDRCVRIDKLFEEVDDLKEKLAELKQSVKCPNCGEYNKNGSLYCSHCGAAIDYTEDADAEEEIEKTEEKIRKVVTIRAKKPSEDEE